MWPMPLSRGASANYFTAELPTRSWRASPTVEMQPDLIAHHFAQAGLTEKAIEYLRKAGQRAIKHSAGADAIGHLTRVRELLQSLSAESLSENQVRKHAAFGLEMIQAARSDLAFRHASDCQTEAAM